MGRFKLDFVRSNVIAVDMQKMFVRNTVAVCFAFLTAALAACSDDNAAPAGADAGPDGTVTGGKGVDLTAADPGKNGILVTLSGEDLASVGYDWTSSSLADGDPPAFVDGWALKFDHVLVTVGNLKLNADPDKDEGNPTSVGALVQSAAGPWVVDAVRGGDVAGKSGSPDEKAVRLVSFTSKSDGGAFDTASRYAFSYDFVAPSAAAKDVNLDAAGKALYATAVSKGWTMVYAGTATYKGPAPTAGTVFAKLPSVVKFTLGFANPSTYANCRNTDLQQVGGEFPRGLQTSASGATTAQITLHTDHGFWDTLNVEGTPLHFDPIAAQADTSTGVVTTDDLISADITGFKTRAGETLTWRSTVSDYTAPAGQMKYNANGTSFARANSLASFLAYSAASGGHMNSDGECEVKNNYTP